MKKTARFVIWICSKIFLDFQPLHLNPTGLTLPQSFPSDKKKILKEGKLKLPCHSQEVQQKCAGLIKREVDFSMKLLTIHNLPPALYDLNTIGDC